MPKTVQIRDIDDEVYSALVRRAAEAGLTVPELLRREAARRPLLDRAWELRHSVRGYDALYLTLAEALDAPLLTLDVRLARVPGLRCGVVLP